MFVLEVFYGAMLIKNIYFRKFISWPISMFIYNLYIHLIIYFITDRMYITKKSKPIHKWTWSYIVINRFAIYNRNSLTSHNLQIVNKIEITLFIDAYRVQFWYAKMPNGKIVL